MKSGVSKESFIIIIQFQNIFEGSPRVFENYDGGPVLVS
jgi:hypothetical protein